MEHITIHYDRIIQPMRPMHAVNNGPIIARADQTRGNGDAYRAARIPFARTHDAAFCADYGGEHTVDISAIFPNWDSDPNNPSSYDFVVTDNYLREIRSVGTAVYYRLGSKIEHGVKKYGTLPPKDNAKWADICAHIIAHYNEGWANGFHWDVQYWEIWNEPDLDPDDAANKKCWGGTAAEFYEFYRTAATALKARFPHLKIGGPAVARVCPSDWLDGFLAALTRDGERVPLDFFSWHQYGTEPKALAAQQALVREKLNRAGYSSTESICNEWNYVAGWTDKFIASVEAINGIKGAAYTAAGMCAAQHAGMDMLMYYDARPSVFNGLFDFYTMRPLKGYYPFLAFSELYALGNQVESHTDDPDLYAAAAVGDGGARAAMVVYYTDDDAAAPKTVAIDGDYAECRLLDVAHDWCVVPFDGTICLAPNSVLLVMGH